MAGFNSGWLPPWAEEADALLSSVVFFELQLLVTAVETLRDPFTKELISWMGAESFNSNTRAIAWSADTPSLFISELYLGRK